MEGAERGSGVPESQRWAVRVAGLPDEFPKTRPATSMEIPLGSTKGRDGMGWDGKSMEQG